MNDKIERYKKIVIVVMAIEVIALLVFRLQFKVDVMTAALIVVVQAVVIVMLFERFEEAIEKQAEGIQSVIGKTSADAFEAGGLGTVGYDEDYVITSMSELFINRHINRVGHKVLTWLPEVDPLFSGKEDTVYATIDDRTYMIQRNEDELVLLFKDITELVNYKTHYENEKVVIGIASLDNYDESTSYVDETVVSAINTAVRSPLFEYCANYGILTKRLSSSRYFLVLNEKIFEEIERDRFSVLTKVRKGAQKQDVLITLSMSFARGTADFAQLDQMVTSLLDLAQTRGGDQVATQVFGQDVKYYGGASEAAEKRSRVRVRVMSHALRDLINRSGNVIICGHKTADFDCIGSAMGIARIAQKLKKDVCIISKTGGIEEKLAAAMRENQEELNKGFTFVTESEALNRLNDRSLVIMTDHHNIKQSNGSKVLENAKRIVVIDHHRRSTEIGVKPVLVYIEAGASSTCELVTEMLPYVSSSLELSELDATMMLTGMIVDTQVWRFRTGARTYDAAATLKEMGADATKAFGWLKDSFDEYALKAQVAVNSERYDNGIVIACVKDRVLTRSIMSQVADSLLGIQGVKGSFVIANDSSNESAISARSTGKINVQMIMEQMNGGGHMTAAAVQRQKCNLDDLKQELLDAIETYFKEENSDESNS